MMVLARLTPPAWRDYVGVALVALVPLLYVYMPRPPIEAARLVVFPAIGCVLLIFVMWFLARQEAVDRQIVLVLLFLLILSVGTSVSFFVNASEIRRAAILEVLRPALFAVFLLFGYYVARAYGEPRIRRGLLLAAYLVLIGQLVIAAAQILGFSSLGLLYSEEKTRPLGTILRATGSLGNPTIFAWVVAQAVAIIYALNRRRFLPWFLVGGLLVLASGSRSMVLLFPFVVALMGIFLRADERISFVRAAGVGLVMLAGLLACIFLFTDIFRYLAELRKVVELGSLTSIGSFAHRVTMWRYRYGIFSEGGALAWMFGLGSRDVIRVVDSDYLYVLFRLGLAGLIAHSAAFVYAGKVLHKARRHRVAVIGMQYLVSSVLLGVLFETLGGWNFPLLLFFYVGLSVGVSRFRASASTASLHHEQSKGRHTSAPLQNMQRVRT